MKKNILKVYGFAVLLALGANAWSATEPDDEYRGYVSLSVATASTGLGKISLQTSWIGDAMQGNSYWKDSDKCVSGHDHWEAGQYVDYSGKRPIEFFIFAKPTEDGCAFEGFYLDDACLHPLSENTAIIVDCIGSNGELGPQSGNLATCTTKLLSATTYKPTEATVYAVNVPTIDVYLVDTGVLEPTRIYAKFVKTTSPAVAKIGDKEYETLAAAVAAANDGDTVTIVSSEPVSIDGVSIGKNVTIEGAGADKTVLDMGTGSMGGVASKTVTYRNLTLRYSNTGTMPYTQGVNHAMQAYDHVTIAGSIAVMDDTLFNACTFTGALDDGTTVPEYLVWIYAHKATFCGCTFEKAGSKGSIKLYAEAGNMCATEVAGTTFKEIGSKGSAIYTSNSNNSSSTAKVVYEVVTDDASITVPEGKVIVKASGNGLSVVNPVKDANGKYIGGQFITASTDQATIESIIGNVCAEGYAPKKNDDGTYGVEAVAKNFFQDETDKSLWHIANVAGLKEFGAAVKAGLNFAGQTVVLDDDMDMSGVTDWEPISHVPGHTDTSFGGVFDGQGHVISNFSVQGSGGFGFFATLQGPVTIKNVTFDRASVSGSVADKGNVVGIVAAYAYMDATFEDITIRDSNVWAFGKVAAIVGMAADSKGTTTFRKCKIVNTTVKGAYNCGGLCGLAQNVVVVEDCDADGATFVVGGRYPESDYIDLAAKATCGDETIDICGKFWKYDATYCFAAWDKFCCYYPTQAACDWKIEGLDCSVDANCLACNVDDQVVEVEVKIPDEIEAKDETGAPITDKDAAEKAVEAATTAVQEIAGNKSAEMSGTGVGEAVVEKNSESGEQEVKPSIVNALASQVDAAEGLTENQKADVKAKVSESKDVSSYVNVKVESPLVKVETVQEQKVATVEALVYDVQPIAVTKVTTTVETEEPKTVTVEAPIENKEIAKPILFRLPITDDFAMSAKVRHESGDPNYPTEEFVRPVLGVAGARYVEITTLHFSTFILSPYNAVVTESDETLGIVKVAKTAGGETVAGVPFRKFDPTTGAAATMTVDQLLVAGFGTDDDIYAYNPAKPSGDEYDMWAWDGEKWNGVAGQTLPPAAESAEIASGKAFWFKDESGLTTPLTLAGLYQANVATAVEAGRKSLLVNPYPAVINAAEKLKEGACEGDQFALVGGDVRYEFRDGAWGVVAKGEVVRTLAGGVKIYGPDTFTAKDVIEIPAGQAFWYISTGATAPTVVW